MLDSVEDRRWFARYSYKSEARLRLFCLPFAGGGASLFRTWNEVLPSDVEVIAIQLPGRENRFIEPPYTRIVPLLNSLLPEILPLMDLPYAVFGHSMGAIISFELARFLRQHHVREPIHVFVSAQSAPQLANPGPHVSGLADDAFLQAWQRLGGIPDEMMRDQELRELMLPLLRADAFLCESYEFYPAEPLTCRFTAFAGSDDVEAPINEMADWAAQTTGVFELHVIPGSHLFINQSRDMLLGLIANQLVADLTSLG